MLIYFVIGALCLVFVALAEYVPVPLGISARVWNHLGWVLAFLSIFLLAALRFDIGTDYSSTDGFMGYVEIFRIYADGNSIRYGIDPAWQGLIYFISFLGGNAQWFFVVTSALVCALVLRACKRLSCTPLLSVALFLVAGLYLESYNIIRQWIAIACILNAFAWVGWSAEDGNLHPGGKAEQLEPYAANNKVLVALIGTASGHRAGKSFVRYAFWVLLATCAHSTAILWLFVWPFFSLKLDTKRVLLAIIACVGLVYVGWNVLMILLEGTRYTRYFYNPESIQSLPHIRWNAIITTGCSLAFCLFCYRGQEKREGTYGRWASSLVVTQVFLMAILISEAFLPYIVDRVARYFAPLLVLQIPYALAELDNKRLRQLFAVGICGLWLAASCVSFAGGKDDVLPYRSILTTPVEEIDAMFNTYPEIPINDLPLEEVVATSAA